MSTREELGNEFVAERTARLASMSSRILSSMIAVGIFNPHRETSSEDYHDSLEAAVHVAADLMMLCNNEAKLHWCHVTEEYLPDD